MILKDLPDDRRSKKTWLPADDRDVTGGLVVQGKNGLPECPVSRIMSAGTWE